MKLFLWFAVVPVDEGDVEDGSLLSQSRGEWVTVLHPRLPQRGTRPIWNSHVTCSVMRPWCSCFGVTALASSLCAVKIESWCPVLPGRPIRTAKAEGSGVKVKAMLSMCRCGVVLHCDVSSCSTLVAQINITDSSSVHGLQWKKELILFSKFFVFNTELQSGC